jgi:hypothetical protein
MKIFNSNEFCASIEHDYHNISIAFYYMLYVVIGIVLIESIKSERIVSLEPDANYIDTSKCTWTEWSVCSLKPGVFTACESSRSFDLAPDQTSGSSAIVPCYHQAGSIESKPCQDGNCPNWIVGNWSDCSNTCSFTTNAEVWSAMQVREVQCGDARGWFYDEKVCLSIRGQKPMTSKACACSHQTTDVQPYRVSWNTVEV